MGPYGMSFLPGAAASAPIGSNLVQGLSMMPGMTQSMAPAGAAAGGGGASMLGSALGNVAGNAGGIIGSILGPLISGERARNKAQTAILQQLLKTYLASVPMRTGIQSSLLGRLPEYMRANFPQNMNQAAQPSRGITAQAVFGPSTNKPRFPTTY